MSAAATAPSLPTLCAFQPVIRYQREVCDLVRDWDYGRANLEVLLSGSFGSAKSTLMAHLGVRHCIEQPGARLCLARRALPDLKRTLWREVLDHISVDLKDGKHYEVNLSSLTITFRNGSQVICASWADGRYKRFRSLKLSMILFEEMVENDDDDETAFKELRARLRRITRVGENLLIGATNPDSPSHWVHRYFIDPQALHPTTAERQAAALTGAVLPPPERTGIVPASAELGGAHPTRRVFYSNTMDNPFIDPAYVAQLAVDLSPREADRYIRGRWVEIRSEFIYYAYDSKLQYRAAQEYVRDKAQAIHLTFDFNIGDGKPMSCALFQFIGDEFHVFAESVIEGARTADLIEDLDARGLLDRTFTFEVNGDAAGKHRDTRSSRSDYDIIMHELQARGCRAEYNVPLANPPVRTRHNRVNAYCLNDAKRRRLFIYKGCKVADEGMRLTALKKGAGYIEDDSKAFQHITTAIGYGILSTLYKHSRVRQGTVQL